MSKNKSTGPVSLSLATLKAQVNTLFEEAGGEAAIGLLDKLSQLNPSEQKLALKLMSDLVDRLISGAVRLNDNNSASKRFEEELYNDLLSSLNLADSPIPLSQSKLKLEVVSGGKSQNSQSNTVVNLCSARSARRASKLSTIN